MTAVKLLFGKRLLGGELDKYIQLLISVLLYTCVSSGRRNAIWNLAPTLRSTNPFRFEL